MATYRFKGRATGQDPEGYYWTNWGAAQSVSVLASTKAEATRKALTLLGLHPRHGRKGFGNRREIHGWAIKWDSIAEEPGIGSAELRGELRRLVSDWQANGNTSDCCDAAVWHKTAQQLLNLMADHQSGDPESGVDHG